MDLAAVALWSFMVAVAGGIAGLVLGNLRLGGNGRDRGPTVDGDAEFSHV